MRSYHRSKAFASRPRRRMNSRYTCGLRSNATTTSPLHHQKFTAKPIHIISKNICKAYAPGGEETDKTWPAPSLRRSGRRERPRHGASRPPRAGSIGVIPPQPALARARRRAARPGGTSRPPPPSPFLAAAECLNPSSQRARDGSPNSRNPGVSRGPLVRETRNPLLVLDISVKAELVWPRLESSCYLLLRCSFSSLAAACRGRRGEGRWRPARGQRGRGSRWFVLRRPGSRWLGGIIFSLSLVNSSALAP